MNDGAKSDVDDEVDADYKLELYVLPHVFRQVSSILKRGN